jgi:hypothetical protein
MARTVVEIDKQIEQLKAYRQKLAVHEAQKKRASENRQKAIIGGWVMSNRPELVQEIVSQLKRPQDRRAFELPDESSEAPTSRT